MTLKMKNKCEYQSSTFRRLIAEGEAKGEVKGKVKLLEVLLESRGFHLDADFRQLVGR